ncbi:MAG TPA: aldolase/citrate lyase family protein [Candidatus Limnocylindrales bacterium]|nr:aldolase/citrate lyase family protein [Candidatus Limnocylindrales bacterium]
MSNDAAITAPSIPPRGDLRRRVLAGEATIGLWLSLGSIIASEVVARAGYDWVVVDLEHGMAGEAELLGQLAAVQATPTAALVRAVSAERMRVARALDLGADGLVIPRLETVEEMRETLGWMRFPPAGIRGVAAGTRGPGYGTVPHAGLHALNERITGVFQVESTVAVEAADELAGIDGVDVLFVGPADLSHDLGIPGEFSNPRFTDALDRVAAAAAAHGKAAGMLLGDASEVPAYLDRGYRFLGIGSDLGQVIKGARSQLAEARRALG